MTNDEEGLVSEQSGGLGLGGDEEEQRGVWLYIFMNIIFNPVKRRYSESGPLQGSEYRGRCGMRWRCGDTLYRIKDENYPVRWWMDGVNARSVVEVNDSRYCKSKS
jgi:hypothetical protein